VVDFRYHIVSIVAVFLALAIGIVLGTYTINGQVLSNIRHQVRSLRHDNDGLHGRIRTLERQQGQDRAFVAAVDPLIVRDRLSKQRVVVVLAPGASGGMAKDVGAMLDSAGATVSATVKMTKTWTDPTQQPLLDNLATRLVEPGIALPDGTAYERIGLVLANALLRPTLEVSGNTALTSADTTALAGLETAKLISVAPDHPAPADLAVLVVPGAPDQPSKADQAAAVAVGALARELDVAGGGTVVVGAPAAAESGGVINAVRADGEIRKVVSTVDDADTETGRIRLVLALAAELRDTTGQYGVGAGANAPAPSPAPTPSR
jgi:hypothetical protein